MVNKEVVDLKKELGVGAKGPLEPKRKVFRFKKLQAPLQAVKLKDGRKVQFQVRKLNTGGYSKFGLFETEDEEMAKALRETVGTQHVISV